MAGGGGGGGPPGRVNALPTPHSVTMVIGKGHQVRSTVGGLAAGGGVSGGGGCREGGGCWEPLCLTAGHCGIRSATNTHRAEMPQTSVTTCIYTPIQGRPLIKAF